MHVQPTEIVAILGLQGTTTLLDLSELCQDGLPVERLHKLARQVLAASAGDITGATCPIPAEYEPISVQGLSMFRITATEAQEKLDSVLREAQRQPVEILRQGDRVAVLLSADEYARLKPRDRRVVLAGELESETVRRIRAAKPPSEASSFDAEVD